MNCQLRLAEQSIRLNMRISTRRNQLGFGARTTNINNRYKIIGVEVIGLSAFFLVLVLLELFQTEWNQVVQNFAWAYAIVGITLVLIGLEILSLTRQLPVPVE